MKVKTSPPLWQPKQWKIWRCGLTLKLGDFSLWNAQSATKFAPAFFSGRYAPMTSTMSLAARMRSRVAGESVPAMSYGQTLHLFLDVDHRRFLDRRGRRFGVRWSGFDQDRAQVFLDVWPDEGLLKYAGLNGREVGNVIAAIFLHAATIPAVVVCLPGLELLGGVVRRVEQGEHDQQHAGEP